MSIPIQTSAPAPRTTASDIAETYPRIQQRRKSMNLAIKIARVIQGEDDATVREAMNMVYPELETQPVTTACQGEDKAAEKTPELQIA